MYAGGKTTNEQGQSVRGRVALKRMDVVDGDDKVVGEGRSQLIEELVDTLLGRPLEHKPAPDARKARANPRCGVREKGSVVAEPLVAGKPHPGAGLLSQHLGQEGALPIARPGDDRHEAPLEAQCHLLHEVLARKTPLREPRRKEACREDFSHEGVPAKPLPGARPVSTGGRTVGPVARRVRLRAQRTLSRRRPLRAAWVR